MGTSTDPGEKALALFIIDVAYVGDTGPELLICAASYSGVTSSTPWTLILGF